MLSEKSDKASNMGRAATLEEASGLLRKIAGDRRADESIKGMLRRVQRRLEGWSHGRIRAVWYGDERVHLRAEEIEQLRALTEPVVKIETQDELSELRNRIARLENLLETSDEAFHSPTLAALRAQGRQVG